MNSITDEFMREMLAKTRSYTVVILRATPKRRDPGADKIVWEHGRRNFQLRAEGVLSIVCPVSDGTDVSGVAIFKADPEATRTIMENDPGVKAGIFEYDIHPTVSFPGDALPSR